MNIGMHLPEGHEVFGVIDTVAVASAPADRLIRVTVVETGGRVLRFDLPRDVAKKLASNLFEIISDGVPITSAQEDNLSGR